MDVKIDEIENKKEEFQNTNKENNNNERSTIKSLDSSMELDKGEAKVIQLESVDDNNIDLSFKVIVIGNSSVGKSSLVDRATKNRFIEDYTATIGFDYFSFYIKYDNKIIKLQIWDTCGQEIYQSLITNFYRNSSLALMVYAIDDRMSFENLDNWLKELKRESNPGAKIILIGNKVDLESDRVVSKEEAEKFAKDYNFSQFFETSAKTGFNTQKVFINTGIMLYEDYIKYKNSDSSSEIDMMKNNHNLSENGSKLSKFNNRKDKSQCC